MMSMRTMRVQRQQEQPLSIHQRALNGEQDGKFGTAAKSVSQ